ncbi:hypothetical protein [Methylobacterium oryzihabitans]|uniref:Uncharacterized protein n=1 Tax=Methylobacterium oryzihabitans TaxID=2499852 RepID=A0A3S2V2S0_9HYPH|nr:hypothetical protein [Methylobacterium oryzihabitans]RVU13922.1 hypothetical protein EOE48_25620 [Methylobacterium oryzihabitans]
MRLTALCLALGAVLAPGPAARALDPGTPPSGGSREVGADLLRIGRPEAADRPGEVLPLYRNMPASGVFATTWNGIAYVPFQAHALEPLDRDFSGDGDRQRSQVYIRSTTTAPGDVAEYPLFVDMLATPSRVEPWSLRKAYAAGTLAKANGNVYRAARGGTSAAKGGGPSGDGKAITDGSVVWEYRCADQCDAKIAAGFTATSMPGSGNVWAMTTNTVLRPGAPTNFVVGYESDLTNYSENCPIDGRHFCVNLWLYGNTLKTSTAHLVLSTGAPAGIYANYFGMWIQAAQGGNVAKDADIADDASGAIGLGFGQTAGRGARHATATIRDLTTSRTGLELSGAYGHAAIDLQGADVAVDGHGIVLKAGQDICFEGGNRCLFYDAAAHRLRYKVNGEVKFAIDDNGNLILKGAVLQNGAP